MYKIVLPVVEYFVCVSVYECSFFGKTIEWSVQGGVIKSKSRKEVIVTIQRVTLYYLLCHDKEQKVILLQGDSQKLNYTIALEFHTQLNKIDLIWKKINTGVKSEICHQLA